MYGKALWKCLVLVCFGGILYAEEQIGKRPYEMVWANRTSDTHPALVDFENLDGWTVECVSAAATLTRSREQQLWGQYVAKLVYRGTGPKAAVTLRPPKPIAVSWPFDCLNLWAYGNNWAWVPDRTTPQVEIAALLRGKSGQSLRIPLGRVNWQEWWVMHRKLSKEQLELLGGGAVLEGIQVSGGRNKDDRVLYFDNLACYQEKLAPLTYEKRPLRGIQPFPGQTTGTNTGPGKLPFPTREETILPDNLTSEFTTQLEQQGDTFIFHYRGKDGHLAYRYRPATGTLGDVTVQWDGRGERFQPMAGGGLRFWSEKTKTDVPADKIEPSGCRHEGDTVVSTWRCTFGRNTAEGRQTAEVVYTLRLMQKSLVIDVKCPGGMVSEFQIGRAVGVENPRLVTLPYLTGGQQRPAVLVTGPADKPLFTFAIVDHCRSNASQLWFVNAIAKDGVAYNGGSRYQPKTDGRRNDCFERLFLTVSPRFEEVLPNIPNPRSPWMHVAGERLWRAHGASNREHDYARWKEVARYGMTKIVITDHETGWRDGGESFTFRTKAAPGRGGDASQADYSRKIRALGFRYGIYNNYTDYAPVNEFWNEDWVSRLPDGQWRTAWARCYNPKPSRAVEMEAKLAPVIQQKFQLDTAYCDVHTAVTPWAYCDFDARVPGAGTFAATFYAYGEIMLHQKKTWNGPVYSEGNNHWYYCGLTDGNYGQDQVARLAENPWLVDFDLRKMHPLCCNFGMGSPDMFYVDRRTHDKRPKDPDVWLDRFLAATLAFGHTGFFVLDGGMTNAVRSYFNLQQVHARYAQETAVDIRYADEQGHLLDTSAAVATGAYKRSQIMTRYSNGMVVAVNGHPTETWKLAGKDFSGSDAHRPTANTSAKWQACPAVIELPPNGWCAKDVRTSQLEAHSSIVDGHRADYVDSPAYTYSDGRGRFTRFPKAASDGQMIAHRRAEGTRAEDTVEVIPVGKCATFGVAVGGRSATAVALDVEGKPLGPVETRLSRGLVYVTPKAGAFSYVLTPSDTPAVSLDCDRDSVIPGETVTLRGKTEHKYRIPADARPGVHLWHQVDGQWIDFAVTPLVDATLEAGKTFSLELISHLPAAAPAEVTLAGASRKVELSPRKRLQLEFPCPHPQDEEVREIPLRVVAGDLATQRSWWLRTQYAELPLVTLPEEFSKGQCLRGAREEPWHAKNLATVHWSNTACGEAEKHCLFMHPPYHGGVGYTFALFGPMELPADAPAVFRCEVGKADGSDPGDGILFRIAIVEGEKETTVAEKQWIQHAWTPLDADLSRWAGKRIRVKLITDVGSKDNSSGDWGCWAEMRIESKGPTLGTTLHDSPVSLDRQPGPHPITPLTLHDLRAARRGILHFEAIGLGHSAPYISSAKLNGVSLGELPGVGGDEVRGKWGAGSLAVPANAIATLAAWNQLTIANPGNDSFAIGRFWIELELADGRKCSSQVTVTRFKQPPEWPYGSGLGVPFGQDIATKVRFVGL